MKRILLKLSGEALAGAEKKGFDEATVIAVAKQIRAVAEEGTQIGIVIGGGNFWRGRTSETINRNKADQIGMLATVMNCIYVSDICRYLGLKTEIFTPFVCGAFTKLYSKDAVEEAFAEGKILFFAGGTGHPYFSTDTATVLRAVEIEAEAILLAKAVDGIYDHGRSAEVARRQGPEKDHRMRFLLKKLLIKNLQQWILLHLLCALNRRCRCWYLALKKKTVL